MESRVRCERYRVGCEVSARGEKAKLNSGVPAVDDMVGGTVDSRSMSAASVFMLEEDSPFGHLWPYKDPFDGEICKRDCHVQLVNDAGISSDIG